MWTVRRDASVSTKGSAGISGAPAAELAAVVATTVVEPAAELAAAEVLTVADADDLTIRGRINEVLPADSELAVELASCAAISAALSAAFLRRNCSAIMLGPEPHSYEG